VSLAPLDSISRSSPYCPTNAKVLEAMARFQNKSNAEQQPIIAQCSTSDGDNPNFSSVSNAEQATLRSEEDIDLATAVDWAISADSAMAERPPSRSPTSREGIQIRQLLGDDKERAGCESANFVDSPLQSTTAVDETVGGWQRLRGLGRGRGRILSVSASGSGVSDAAVGSQRTRQLLGDDRERAGSENAYFADSPFQSTTAVDDVEPVGDKNNECSE